MSSLLNYYLLQGIIAKLKNELRLERIKNMKLSKAVLRWNRWQAKRYAERLFPASNHIRMAVEKAYIAGAAYGAANQHLDEQFHSTGEEWPLPP